MILELPREAQKSSKIEKRPSKNRSKKRPKKKRRHPQFLVECGGTRAAQGIQRFRSGRLLPSTENKSKARQHSRRSAADCCSLTRGPPHSTTLLALADVQRIAQNLGGSCQNLERILAISAAILAAKWNCICSFQCQEILQKSFRMPSQTIKIHKNGLTWRPIKKISPQDRKRCKKEPKDKNICQGI